MRQWRILFFYYMLNNTPLLFAYPEKNSFLCGDYTL